jgi:hypothetical protein
MLPAAGCKSVPSVDVNGNVSYKSSVYTEYFVRGREPLETCSVHSEAALAAAVLVAPAESSSNPLRLPEAPPESPPPMETPSQP